MIELVVDNFAGGGGASAGIEEAIGRPVDVAINHNAEAIAIHRANHPLTQHYQEDIWQVDPRAVAAGRPIALVWLSPDCTHFSKAKGGKPREQGIRGLAWVGLRWAGLVRPRVLMLENVEEFQTWGPLNRRRHPKRTRRGETFRAWVGQLRALGYEVEWRELRACDHGAPTLRKRLFIIARCDGQPIKWPAPTHGKGMGLLPYRTAAECIDWFLPCPSIFERARPLADATMRRIANGIRRYVIEAEQPFIVHLTHHGGDRTRSVDEPISTVTGAHRGEQALVTPTLIQTGYGERAGQAPRSLDLQRPLGTVVGGGVKHGLVTPFLARTAYKGANGSYVNSLDEPVRTLTAQQDGLSLVAPVMTSLDHQSSQNGSARADTPVTTVTAKNRHMLVSAFMAKHFGGHGTPGSSLELPLGTATATDHHALVSSHLTKLYGTSQDGAPLDRPMPTVTATGQHIAEVRAFLLKYYGNDRDGQPLIDPLHTVTAKERFALGVVVIQGQPYQIIDIGMRMLTPRELFRAQGFPDSYVIDPLYNGKPLSKTAQIRACGNSVCPPLARALVAANVGRLGQQQLWAGHEVAEVAS